MTVGELVAFLKLDKSQYTAALDAGGKEAKTFSERSDKAFKSFEKAAKYAFVAVGAAIGLAIKKAVDFGGQINMVNTMLVYDSKVSLETFRKGITQASVAFGQGTATLSKGLYDILSASVPADQALRVLNDSAKAAVAGFTETGVAADALTTMMNAYGDATYNSAHASDVLFTTVVRGKTTFPELAEQIGDVATLAAKSKLSMEQMGAMLAILTRNGLNTSIAVTDLRAILSTLLQPTDDLTAALGDLNVMNGDFVAIMERVAQLPPDVQAKLFPNVRALTGIVVAAGELNSELDIFGQLMAKGSQTTMAFEKASSGAGFQWKQMKESLNAALVEIGNAMIPAFKVLLGIVTSLTTWVAGWSDGMKTAAVVIAGLVVSVFPLIKIIQGVAAAIEVWKVAQVALNATLLGTPIGMIAAGLAVLAVGTVAVVAKVKEMREEQKKFSDDIIAGYNERIAKEKELGAETAANEGTFAEINYWQGQLAVNTVNLTKATGERQKQLQAERQQMEATIKTLQARRQEELKVEGETQKLTQGQLDFQAASKKMLAEWAKIDSMVPIYQALNMEYDSAKEKQQALQKAIEELTEKGYVYAAGEKNNIGALIALYERQADVRQAGADQEQARAEALSQSQQDLVDAIRERLAEEEAAYAEHIAELQADDEEARRKKLRDTEAANAQLRQQFADLMQDEYTLRLRSLDKQYQLYRQAGVDLLQLDTWYAKEKKALFEDLEREDPIQKTIKGLQDLGEQIGKTFAGEVMAAVYAFGEAMGEGSTSGSAMAKSLRGLGQAIQAALPNLLMSAGLQLLPYWPAGTIIGVGLLIASGIASWANGLLEGADLRRAQALGQSVKQGLSNYVANPQPTEEELRIREELRRALLSPYERALEDLDAERQRYIDAGAPQSDIDTWYQQELDALNELYPPEERMERGGVVNGRPGTDATMIRATRGEYVMPVEQTQQNLQMLEAMRAGMSPTVNMAAVPVTLEISGREIGRAVIKFIEDETAFGGIGIDRRSVRTTG